MHEQGAASTRYFPLTTLMRISESRVRVQGIRRNRLLSWQLFSSKILRLLPYPLITLDELKAEVVRQSERRPVEGVTVKNVRQTRAADSHEQPSDHAVLDLSTLATVLPVRSANIPLLRVLLLCVADGAPFELVFQPQGEFTAKFSPEDDLNITREHVAYVMDHLFSYFLAKGATDIAQLGQRTSFLVQSNPLRELSKAVHIEADFDVNARWKIAAYSTEMPARSSFPSS